MLIAKYPRRFNRLGAPLWKGVIYGDGAVGLPLVAPVVYHGRFGAGLFQSIYTRKEYSLWGTFILLEWHAVATGIALLSLLFPPLLIVSLAMWALTAAAAWRTSRANPLPSDRPWWCAPVVFALHVLQPIVRTWHRYCAYIGGKRLPAMPEASADGPSALSLRRVGSRYDAYWTSNDNRGREHLLEALERESARLQWRGLFHEHWSEWDVMLISDRWWSISIATATEELGWPKRFTRARVEPVPTLLTKVGVGAFVVAGAAVALATRGHLAAMLTIGLVSWGVMAMLWVRQRRVLAAVEHLLARAGRVARLDSFVPPSGDNAQSPGVAAGAGAGASRAADEGHQLDDLAGAGVATS